MLGKKIIAFFLALCQYFGFLPEKMLQLIDFFSLGAIINLTRLWAVFLNAHKGRRRIEMFRSKTVDVVRGPLLSSIIRYSLPVMIGSLIQVLFNAADLMVLGNFAGGIATAAVGATGPIVGLIVNSVIGLSGGTNVILARAVGAGDSSRVRKIVDTSLITAVVLGFVMMGVGLSVSGWFLRITDCPVECIDGAKLYINIYFCGLPAILIYNYGAAIIRVSGDSERPLYYMIASGILNVVMNLVLCIVLEQKVAAVAIATLLSQVLGAVLVVRRLIVAEGDIRVNFKKLSFSAKELKNIMVVGIPCAVNNSLYNISNLQIQSAINSFGPEAIAGGSAAASVEGIVSSFTGAFSVSTLAFVGQNIGVGDRQRVKKSIIYCSVLSVLLGVILGDGLFLVGKHVLALYIPGEELAIQYGLVRMTYILAIYFVAGLNGVLSSTVQAFGHTALPMINGIATTLLFRVVWMTFIYPYLPVSGDGVKDIHNLYSCYSWSWGLNLAFNAIIFFFIYRAYKKGHVKNV